MSRHTMPTGEGHSRRRFLTAGAAVGGAVALNAAVPSWAQAQLPSVGLPSSRTVPFTYWPDRPFFNFQLLRLIGESPMSGADFSEVNAAAYAIGDVPNEELWVREFEKLGHDLLDRSARLAASDPAGARTMALRAANYLRSAEFFIHPIGPELDRKIALFGQVRTAFAAAVRGSSPRVEAVQVPYENTALHAYYVHPEAAKTKTHPAVVFFGGLDSLGEELYLWAGMELARRGIGVLVVDGPGNGASIRYRNILTRHDYEVAAKAAVDFLVRRPKIDQSRIGLIGISLGGYYAARSAAFERRLRATVVWGAIWDTSEILTNQGDPETKRFLAQYGLWVFGGNNPAEALQKSSRFKMAEVAHLIRNPIFIIHGEEDGLVPVEQAYKLHEAIRAPKALHIVPKGRPGSTHCQADSIPAAWEAMLPWLLDHLEAAPAS